MKEGAFAGAVIALLIYSILPIYNTDGPAALIPTGNAVSSPGAYSEYLGNLPFSMVVFTSLELLGISLGIAAQMMFRKGATEKL